MFGKVKDPVCGVKVKKTTQYRCSLNGKTFYFDSAACRQTFTNDSQRFLGGGDRKKKGLIARLAEASDGQPKTCHQRRRLSTFDGGRDPECLLRK